MNGERLLHVLTGAMSDIEIFASYALSQQPGRSNQ